MRDWQIELLDVLMGSTDSSVIFDAVASVGRKIDFDYLSYMLVLPVPLTRPKILSVNNYPYGWQEQYRKMNYAAIDPTIHRSPMSDQSLIWSDAVFARTPTIRNEAEDAGIRHGWVCAVGGLGGARGTFTLARRENEITSEELSDKAHQMTWLAHTTHMTLSKALMNRVVGTKAHTALTSREIDVLKWTADGKTAREIAQLLAISTNTINFHVKNIVSKLDVTNKTQAVITAAFLGLLQ
ncbi:DNA-binding CsgD family transcriptional regulator [Caballeronia udeis]|uniref:DNA-binding CsgD family transcriptional regulator n=1 Tax=Caballeronia udeis TaxID=1232866 RepID=A0ABW8MY47_9BURK